jgi:hypothetical protein
MEFLDYMPEYPSTHDKGYGYCIDVDAMMKEGIKVENLYTDVCILPISTN